MIIGHRKATICTAVAEGEHSIRLKVIRQRDRSLIVDSLVRLLGAGNPMARLKDAIEDMQHRAGGRFEDGEVIDLTKNFIAAAQGIGYEISGIGGAA